MKFSLRASFIILIQFFAISLFAQPAIQWQKRFGGSQRDAGYSMCQTPDGGYIVSGWSNSNDDDFPDHHGTTAKTDGIVIKLDSAGNMQWKRSLGGSDNDGATCLILAHGGGYILAGGSSSNDGDVAGDHHGAVGVSDGWIIKLDTNGNTLWAKSYGGTAEDDITRIVQSNDGGYVFAARSLSNDGDVTGHHGSTSNSDYWVVKIDSAGNILWEKSLGGTAFDAPFALTATDDSAYVLAGDCSSNDGVVTGNHGGSDIWVVKIDATGNILWENSFGSSFNEDMNSVTLATDGGYIVGCSAYGTGGNITVHYGHNDEYDIWVFKLSRAGALVWQKSYGGNGRDYEQDVHATNDNGCLIAGYSTSNDIDVSGHHGDTTNYDAWVVKVDSLGTIEWQRSLGGTAMEGASSIIPTRDGGVAFAGNTQSGDGDLANLSRAPLGNEDGWIVKLAPLESSTLVANGPIVERAFDIFPNPARSNVQLDLRGLAIGERASAEVTDALGRTCLRIALTPGAASANVPLDLSSLAAGAYIIRINNAGSESIALKLLEVVK
ncbi:MAG TPA: T9SS type A sorting domain-containing protein [Candidatus Kapabacteria bacterium]|nr:T9SS type A sorting domain-containing protein [Candidatus Kapabacteria bacterium]